MGDAGIVLLVVGVLAMVGLVLWLHRQARRKKIAEFTAFAVRRGWRYLERDRGLVKRFNGAPFGRGHDRRAEHVLRGTHRGRRLVAFEYSYKETEGSGDDRRTRTYPFTVVGLATPAPRPTLELSRESWGRRLLGLVGVRDLELESEEFNRTFRIRTEDDKFAYDILHPRMMAWMLADERARSVPFRFERGDLVVWTPGRVDVVRVGELLDYACDILDRTPDFVWKPAPGG